MSAIIQQIKTAFEVENMTPAEIAADMELDETAVKAALMQCSSKYRQSCGLNEQVSGLDFSDEQLITINQVIFETATSAERADGSIDFQTRLAAAEYIRDDKKGRKEAKKFLANNTFNLLTFNESIQKVREIKDRMMPKELVDV